MDVWNVTVNTRLALVQFMFGVFNALEQLTSIQLKYLSIQINKYSISLNPNPYISNPSSEMNPLSSLSLTNIQTLNTCFPCLHYFLSKGTLTSITAT